jgi:hypothetical protein
MSIITIINGATPCKFSDIDIRETYINENDEINEDTDTIILKYIDSKYYIHNFNDYEQIKCKLIRNTKIIKLWAKSLNTNFDNSVLFEFKLKNIKCFTTRYYTYVIEINKNDNDIKDFGLLSMNIFQLIPIGSFTTKLCYLNTFISQF